ncbi:hypothetical protein ACTMTI_22710 [Nonomuraea sp. H19]|uniref:hypothetical protein n=1 Tax=Nonomuraea sp. H19 TaxID=3452206 RepID=UPI003F8CCE07
MPKFKTGIAALAATTAMTGGALVALASSATANAVSSGIVAGHGGGWGWGNGHSRHRNKQKVRIRIHNNNQQSQQQAERQDQDQDQDQVRFEPASVVAADGAADGAGLDGIDPAVRACLLLPPGQVMACIEAL